MAGNCTAVRNGGGGWQEERQGGGTGAGATRTHQGLSVGLGLHVLECLDEAELRLHRHADIIANARALRPPRRAVSTVAPRPLDAGRCVPTGPAGRPGAALPPPLLRRRATAAEPPWLAGLLAVCQVVAAKRSRSPVYIWQPRHHRPGPVVRFAISTRSLAGPADMFIVNRHAGGLETL